MLELISLLGLAIVLSLFAVNISLINVAKAIRSLDPTKYSIRLEYTDPVAKAPRLKE